MTPLLHSYVRVLLIAILVQSAFAHTYLSSVYLNGAALAEGDCVRPHPATAYYNPIPLVTSPDMTCGWLPQAANAANRKCPIAAGSSIGLQFHHQSATATDDIIDPTHLGPIMVYLAKSGTGAGNVWFKIYEDGYTAADGKWAVDRLLANGGRVDNIKIPSDIAPGNYLLRGELIALHGAFALNGVQPYVGCVELTISGSGAANPAGVALPGAYSNTDPGMLFELYSAFTKYTIPGPAVYVAGSSPSSSSSSSSSGSSTIAPTKAPTTAPTSTTAPASGSNAKLTVYPSASNWWFAVTVSGNAASIETVELKDAGAVSSYKTMTANPWGYSYATQGTALVTPITVRVTTFVGKSVTATFSSITANLVVEANGSL